MNRQLSFYDYDRCYAHYTKRIMNIRQAKIHGEVIVAKPVLMLALIDGIDNGIFTSNRFVLNEWLEKRYLSLMAEYTRHSQFDKPADIANPFWHLATDGFWHLNCTADNPKGVSPSGRWLKDNVEYAYFDEDLWVLLQNKVMRTRLRDYIVEHKLPVDRWNGMMAAESLGIIAALLMVA